MKLIGKGLLSKVYQLNEKQVLIKSVCYVKECLGNEWVRSTIFPTLQRTDNYGEYICEYYPKVKSLKESLEPKQYAIYQELRRLSIGFVKNKYDLLDEWRKQFETVTNKRFKDGLLEMCDEICNYGTQISFEISPRNVAVKNGKLILLDCFFVADQAEKIRSTKNKRYAY